MVRQKGDSPFLSRVAPPEWDRDGKSILSDMTPDLIFEPETSLAWRPNSSKVFRFDKWPCVQKCGLLVVLVVIYIYRRTSCPNLELTSIQMSVQPSNLCVQNDPHICLTWHLNIYGDYPKSCDISALNTPWWYDAPIMFSQGFWHPVSISLMVTYGSFLLFNFL